VRALAATVLACLAALALVAALARAADAAPPAGLLADVALQYRQAAIAHDAALATRLRAETRLRAAAYPSPALTRLATTVDATRHALQPWPIADAVTTLTERAGGVATPKPPARPYDAIRSALAASAAAAKAGRRQAAVAGALRGYRLSAGPRRRLGSDAAALEDAFWATSADTPGVLTALDRGDAAPAVADAVKRAGSQLATTEQLLGGVAGIGATAVTWLVVRLVISQLGTGGLRLEAITGLAITVLLVITNWFFHKVYWSQWISRFNRQRKSIERLDRFSFVSGQALALAILGLTSVYREGFETVLFIQNLQVSAGTQACLLGAGIGLAATLAVGVMTFALQRKLPYKKMLIATGVLIAVVLAVMTGSTVHVLQGLGWLPASPTAFSVPIWANSWLGLYATWEGIVLQLLAPGDRARQLRRRARDPGAGAQAPRGAPRRRGGAARRGFRLSAAWASRERGAMGALRRTRPPQEARCQTRQRSRFPRSIRSASRSTTTSSAIG